MEHTVRVDLGLQIADADFIELRFRERSLVLIYRSDWPGEHLMEVLFTDTVAFRLQESEFAIGLDDPCDHSTYEVVDSSWLAAHLRAGYVSPQQGIRHFKFSFGGSSPTVELLCGSVSQRIIED